MDRQTLMRGAAVVGAVFLIGLAFVWSYMGALSNPKFHGVEIAVLGPPALLDHLDAGGELSGTPASGGPYATELLPGLWRTIGHYLPTGAGTDLTRNIAYFGGHALTRPLLVLFLWLSCALVLAALSGPIHTTAVRLRSQRVRAAAERHAVAGT